MLNRWGEQPDASDADRIDRIMQAIPDDTQIANRVGPRRRNMVSWLAFATCLMITCPFVWIKNAQITRAQDLLREIRVASQTAIDIVYQVTREEPNNNRHKTLGKLYLRGTTGFVYICEQATLGRHADEDWAVAATGPVLIAKSFDWIAADSHSDIRELDLFKGVSTASSEFRLMEPASLVKLLEQDYSVTIERSTKLPSGAVKRLVGRRRAADNTLPETILLTFHSQSKLVTRVDLEWEQTNDQREPLRIVFEQVSDEPVTDDWYHHDAHHSDEREVLQITNHNSSTDEN